jgi:hypothetical protein
MSIDPVTVIKTGLRIIFMVLKKNPTPNPLPLEGEGAFWFSGS